MKIINFTTFGVHKLANGVFVALFCTMWLAMTGCASFDMSKRIPWGQNDDAIDQPPMRVTAIWTDTVMTTAGKTPMRGFGGRVMFYGNGEEPIKVAGNLVVYAFDETNRDPSNAKPDRKYVFRAEDLERHYTKGRLGHSYSFWVPWDEVGGRQCEISLIARFTPDGAGVIVGEQSKHMLPGTAALQNAVEQQREQIRQQIYAKQQYDPQLINAMQNYQSQSLQQFMLAKSDAKFNANDAR